MIDFKGKVALVTGAAQGIGAAIAEEFHLLGAHVCTIDIKEIKNSSTFNFCGDILDKNFLTHVTQEIKSKWGAIHILVNNAGIIRDNFLEKISEDDWDQVLKVNLKGPFLLCQKVVPLMKEQNYGKIVNIISRSWLGNIGQTNYAASKGGLVSFTRTLSLELARFGIRVNGVAPGFIDTPMTQSMPEKAKEKLLKIQPGGVMGCPQDIAAAVVFLSSSRADFISGQILHVDGGKSCGVLSL